jgi:hypothetical protein
MVIDSWQSTLLPYPAHVLLVRASMTPISERDPMARQRAIEEATSKVKRDYPSFFLTEEER